MAEHVWQLQEAKQRFSALIRAVEAEGPQVVSRHGRAIAVVLDIEDYHRLSPAADDDFKEFLTTGPSLDELAITRDATPAPRVTIE